MRAATLTTQPARPGWVAVFLAVYGWRAVQLALRFQTLASQLSKFTGGEDGQNFKNPAGLRPSFEPFETEVPGLLIDGKTLTYWLIFGVVPVLWLRYTGPDTTLSFEIMLDILLIVVIGSVLFVLSVYYCPTGVVGRLQASA
jgi:hypothetical protein